MIDDTSSFDPAGVLPPLYALARFGRRVMREVERALADVELRPREFALLAVVEQHDGARQRALGEALGVDRGNFVAVVDALEERGALVRKRD